MDETLPAAMIAQLQVLGQALVRITQEHRAASLATLEQAVLEAVRATLPDLLTTVVQTSTRALQEPHCYWRQPCPRCGQWARVQSWRPRTVLTICGVIRWERPWYVCRPCQHGFSPADASLAVDGRARLSASLHAWLEELGASHSFAEAAWWLTRLTGLHVTAETIRQRTERAGAALEATAQAASATVLRTQEPAAPLDPAPGQLTVETDGVMVRYLDGWHEVKLGLVAGLVDGELQASSYVAQRASPEQFGPRLLAEAARRGALEVVDWQGPVTDRSLAVLRSVVVLGDGAPWIWNLAAEQFGARTEIVDFYHAAEHLGTVAKALYPEDAEAARAWATEQIHTLRDKGIGPVREALRAARAPTPSGAEALRQERGYFRTNAPRMAYPTFREQGLPIGSGAIESNAKRVVQQRMKRPGARWSESGAQAVLNVRCQLLTAQARAA
jgi:hypothetical protein